ncbi:MULTISPECIES: hypothetical protein [Vibrio]|nr:MULTISPECIES: hypothetical protein [Vibrio]ELB2848100.1 hypothetical protein [Vibrio alginolyticus]MBS9909904.1 hypothetical protein [Vibrio alginolyticus]MBT0047845.1 hypothetical protein [Vibrio alginolyticus]MBT0061442.1 hypothetical protein [Vibrio alginolyticus]MCQ9102023.1 hypothetical protein [Vibrio alginolyticus]
MLRNISLLGLIFSSSACASSHTNTALFKCDASHPNRLEISIENINSQVLLSELSLGGSSIERSLVIKDFKLDQYHRALVDEKSLEFSIGERVILVSEYFSEEFDEVEKILSVTLIDPEQTQYFECEEGSMSNLALLFHESAE